MTITLICDAVFNHSPASNHNRPAHNRDFYLRSRYAPTSSKEGNIHSTYYPCIHCNSPYFQINISLARRNLYFNEQSNTLNSLRSADRAFTQQVHLGRVTTISSYPISSDFNSLPRRVMARRQARSSRVSNGFVR